MTTHWIVTNREVVLRDDKEVVNEDSVETLPTFRIAKFVVPALLDPTDDDLRAAVTFVTDKADANYLPSYGGSSDDLPGTAQLFSSVYQAMRQSAEGKGDTLCFLHGFNHSWIDSLRHLVKLSQVYTDPVDSPVSQIIYFSWPSTGRRSDYSHDQITALNSGGVLARLFLKAGAFYKVNFGGPKPLPYCGRRLHLAVHSLGTQVLESFCHIAGGYDGMRLSLFNEILLFNADSDWTDLDQGKPLSHLNELAERVHVYSNHHDETLWVSETTKHSSKRLGRHGPKDINAVPPRTLVVDTTKTLPPAPLTQLHLDRFAEVAQRIHDINDLSTESRQAIVHHWGYLFRSDVVNDIKAVLRGESAREIGNRIPERSDLYSLR
ncbi:alpha/beta hydrolase [Paludibacterium paludis]|uniref:Alpha/beta hydrolase family protein DUF900 n=1 Tax=Paludibacterium paludis TaxID=1225769 RepID=A0A918NYF2_9NEIS|nr:alpha/beta hydrolase [Paludibacterium paludis]GGY05304.1 hypothetical protein GCM10011289_04860 [Paludibacterium paludis]